MTHSSAETPATRDANRLRTRGKHMLELATRAYCEQHFDFARLLTQRATEVFAHARDVEGSQLRPVRSARRLPGERRR